MPKPNKTKNKPIIPLKYHDFGKYETLIKIKIKY